MAATAEKLLGRKPSARRFSLALKIEHLLDWAEPTIRSVCREVWRDARPRGLEIEDLYQEGRIAVFQAAEEIIAATDHAAMVATVVRCQAVDALRLLAEWDTSAPPDGEDASPKGQAPMAAG